LKAKFTFIVLFLALVAIYFFRSNQSSVKISEPSLGKSSVAGEPVKSQRSWSEKKKLLSKKANNLASSAPLLNSASKKFSPTSSFGEQALKDMKSKAVKGESDRISRLVSLDSQTKQRLDEFLEESFEAKLSGKEVPEETLDDIIGTSNANDVRAAAVEQLQHSVEAMQVSQVVRLVEALGLDKKQEADLMSTVKELESQKALIVNPSSIASLESSKSFNALIQKTNSDSRLKFNNALEDILTESQLAEYRNLNPRSFQGQPRSGGFSLAY